MLASHHYSKFYLFKGYHEAHKTVTTSTVQVNKSTSREVGLQHQGRCVRMANGALIDNGFSDNQLVSIDFR